jgi:hypothetical protein
LLARFVHRGIVEILGREDVRMVSMIALMAPPMIAVKEPLLPGDFRVSEGLYIYAFFASFASVFSGGFCIGRGER